MRLSFNRKPEFLEDTIPLRWTRNESIRSHGRDNKRQSAAKHLPQLTSHCSGKLPLLAALCRWLDPPHYYPA
jgi:hypothetical protein